VSEEKLKILQMIQDGKINATEGLELIKALEDSESTANPHPESISHSRLANRFLRVKVNTEGTTKVNVNLPLSLLKVASKFAAFGMNYIPESARQEMEKKGINLSQIDLEELMRLIEEGLTDGKLVDVEVNDPNEGLVKVEVYVE
jgi:hypothetical protein